MEMIKGTLDVLILKTLSWGPLHGYAISRWIRARSGDNFALTQGALYPALRRLESKDLLTSKWAVSETGRDTKVYELTASGQAQMERSIREWSEYVETMANVLHATEFGS